MQTFLPYADFVDSARVLDRSRLGKQRVECKQILTALLDGRGWIHHPATKMWKGYEFALCVYAISVCTEWTRRGYKDTLQPYFIDRSTESVNPSGSELPPWFGDERFHSAHRAALLAKDPDHYSQFGWTEEPGIHYFWPTKEEPYVSGKVQSRPQYQSEA